MTVVQTLKFHAQLKWPNAKMSQVKVDAKDRVSIAYIFCFITNNDNSSVYCFIINLYVFTKNNK